MNCICPGGIATPIFGRLFEMTPEEADETVDTMEGIMKEVIPLGRSGYPRDIADGARWLASDASSFVTGHSLVIDGGLTTGSPPLDLEALGQALGATPG